MSYSFLLPSHCNLLLFAKTILFQAEYYPQTITETVFDVFPPAHAIKEASDRRTCSSSGCNYLGTINILRKHNFGPFWQFFALSHQYTLLAEFKPQGSILRNTFEITKFITFLPIKSIETADSILERVLLQSRLKSR